MATKGVDFSWDKPNGPALRADGFSFVVGYVSPESGKNITKSQVSAYHSAKLNVGIVYEGTGAEAFNSGNAPSVDSRGNSQMDALGAPLSTVLYIAVDRDTSGSAVAAFFKSAVARSKRPIGVYGNYAVVSYLMSRGIVKYGWQTYAWSGGHLYAPAQLFQYSNGHHIAGGTVDYDYQEHSAAGLWMYSTTPVKPVVQRPGTPKFAHTLVPSGKPGYDEDAKIWQTGARTYRKSSVTADGYYGPYSVGVAKAIQKQFGLVEDGIVGPKTWTATFS